MPYGHVPGVLSRRRALQAGAALALGGLVFSRPGVAGAAARDAAALSGTGAFVAAMHVHASYSEGSQGTTGSWEQQYANAAAAGVDVLYQTDHDFRARARGYLTKVSGGFTPASTGAPAQSAATLSSTGAIHLLVEGSAVAATQSLVMNDKPTAVNQLRTGIDGQSFTQVFGTGRLDPGARYEMVLTLSLHPAQAGRPAGVYSLRYRFQSGASAARFTEGTGLVGVVQAPLPANGQSVTVRPQDDASALWPTMMAIDHCSTLLTFVVTSPGRGVVADVRLQSVTVARAGHDVAGVLAAQGQFADTYSPRFGVQGYVEEEVSLGADGIAHLNPFGSPPEFSLKTGVTSTNWRTWYGGYMQRAHAAGGAVSWNHPFGATMGPLLSTTAQADRRRQVYADRTADDLLGADILEVGYRLRGQVPLEAHVDLWDTFSRRCRFLTGNGVSDDHSGRDWRGLPNGFLTGIWAASSSAAALSTALRGGRAYLFHPGVLPDLRLDTLVDSAVPMGAVSVGSATSRTVAVSLANLPSGCTVELLRSPADPGFSGTDPAATVVESWPVAAGTSTLSAAVDTSSSCFVRPQVRRNGALVGIGNPTWLLRSAPPGGIPAPRST